MIVGSLLLILVAVGLLVVGLANGSSLLLITSIAASLLAAVALVVGARQAAAGRASADPDGQSESRWRRDRRSAAEQTDSARRRAPTVPTQHSPTASGADGSGWRQPPEAPVTDEAPGLGTQRAASADPGPVTEDPTPVSAPSGSASGWPPDGPADPDPLDDELSDEPAAQPVSPDQVARLGRLAAEVLVVDGRPRYHLDGCPQLLGRETEPLPVSEAVELGFTSCARCTPATVLLAGVRPV